jgi:uncharacterized protein DUF6636
MGAAYADRLDAPAVAARVVCVLRIALLALALAACAAPTTSAQSLVHFRSPSGNINCVMFGGGAECVVKRQSWPRLPARPAACDLDWVPASLSVSGSRVFVGACRGDVGPLCVGEARCRTLPYGHALTLGKARCVSARNGVTCRRLDGRRVGFRIAREGYTLYR